VKSAEVKEILGKFNRKRILVIGDLMLDHYIWGKVDRISAEAPVPVVAVTGEEYRLGGAANVVNNLASLGAVPVVLGVCGDDYFAGELKKLFSEINLSTDHLLTDKSRPTILKSRVISQHQQMIRIDHEKTAEISAQIEDLIIRKITGIITDVDAVILEDYNKGLLTENVIKTAIKLAKERKIPITVDPKFRHFFSYNDCTVFKPNLSELQKNLGVLIETEEEFVAAARELQKKINADYIIITRGEKGLTIFESGKKEVNIPTFAREVFDVSGAGDTVISTLTLCLVSACDIVTAATIANHAAGKVCGKLGIHAVTQQEILDSFEYHANVK